MKINEVDAWIMKLVGPRKDFPLWIVDAHDCTTIDQVVHNAKCTLLDISPYASTDSERLSRLEILQHTFTTHFSSAYIVGHDTFSLDELYRQL